MGDCLVAADHYRLGVAYVKSAEWHTDRCNL